MKVLNLQCAHRHAFEGWFASEDDFVSQLERGIVECPLCGDTSIAKMPSAPRLSLGAAEPVSAKPQVANVDLASLPSGDAKLQAAWLRAVRHVMANTEDVGSRFAEEARRIHYGETEERGIRGQASAEETQALVEEGIGVVPLSLPKGVKGSLH